MKLMRTIGLLLALFGALGYATTAQAVREAKTDAKDLILKGDAKCTGCHDEADEPLPDMLDLNPGVLRIGKTKHGTNADSRTPTCTNCHGESLDHANYKGKDKPPKPDRRFDKKTDTPAAERNQACLSCHQGGNRINWHSSTHASRDVACVNCHKVHTPHDKVRDRTAQTELCFNCHKEQRAQMNRPSHHPVPEGKMACASCHNVHGDNPKQLVKSSTNETCYTCHMEKRGPFLHNHQPVSEDCSICHQPHGTTVANLLKSRPPLLCQECHSHTSHPGQTAGLPAGRTTSTSALGTIARGCTNCHTNIHGSNSNQNHYTAGRFRR